MLHRPRRNRKSAPIRGHIRETRLSLDNLIFPLFLVQGKNVEQEIASMPGIPRLSLDNLLYEVEECLQLGLRSFVVFPSVPDKLKNKQGSYGHRTDNFYLQAFREVKKKFGNDVCLMSDVALDPYNSDGHDGLVEGGRILNDETLPLLAKQAIVQAEAGADIIGPSDMMDGRVGYLRDALDEAGFKDVSIMAYTAKYASGFYGPFRQALDSAPRASDDIPADKATYQMDPANKREALIEAELDTAEGADYLMIKPALAYLDVIHLLREHSALPIAAYNVSGEYAMIMAAVRNGWLEAERVIPETLTSIRRAGADVILTYFAKWYAESVRI
ncbi:MAG: porphobilinogen synthase [Flavobacteriales bacterium]|nr:porphobilinogen synthase [Flavobacteriales bacterium]